MAGHRCTVLVSGITPGWPLSYFSMMQTSTPRQKAFWPLCTLLLGTETAETPWNSSWWIVTSNQSWRTTHEKLLLISPGGQASITTSLKSRKAVQTLHLRLNDSSSFLKFQSTSASHVWDVKYSHVQRTDVVCIMVFFQVSCLTWCQMSLRGVWVHLWWILQFVILSEVILLDTGNTETKDIFWCWSKRKVFLNIPYPGSCSV